MEAGSDDNDSTLNIASQGSGSSIEDVHCHTRAAMEFFNGNTGFGSREVDVL